jgi:hypothetical protein
MLLLLQQATDVGGVPTMVGGMMLGAFVIVVGMFLKYLSDERKDRAVERREYLDSIEKLGGDFASTVKELMHEIRSRKE